jgi:hypothetical protein
MRISAAVHSMLVKVASAGILLLVLAECGSGGASSIASSVSKTLTEITSRTRA